MRITGEMMRSWMGLDLPRARQRRALHDLAERLREVAALLVHVDAEATDPDALAPATAAAEQLLATLRELPHHGDETTPASAPTPTSLLHERSPVSGLTNPLAPPLVLAYDGERTVGRAIYTVAHEGPVGGVHGGVIAASFDELLGVAQMASGAAGYTGTLTVRFRAVTPIHTEIVYEAWVEHSAGRKLTVAARSTAAGRLLAEAEGVFITQGRLSVPDGIARELDPA